MTTKDPKNIESAHSNLSDSNKSFHEQIDEIRGLVEENLRYAKTARKQESEVRSHENLQKLLKENLDLSKELHEMIKKINRWIAWQRVWGVLKILIILIPIVLGAIYLPPLLSESLAPYRDFLESIKQISSGNLGGFQANE